jgi:type IV pilus assembly protein PilC
MSRDPADRPPRRRRPRPGTPDDLPEADEDAFDSTNTFRPNPAARRDDTPRRAPGPIRSATPDFDDLDDVPEEVRKQFQPTEKAKKPKTRRSVLDADEPSKGGGLVERVVFGRVNSGALARFCRQFGVYLASGVSLTRALDGLAKQFKGTALGPVADRMGVAVRRGETIADAAAREPQAFDNLFLSMIRVAEARGGVPEVLRSLSEHYEARQRMIRQARSAMIYPTAVILITLAVGGLLTIFVLPKLVEILRDMTRGRGIDLPLPTRILMGISDFIQAYGWWLIPLLVVGGGFGLIRAYRTPRGKAVLDEVALRIPVMGKLLRKIDTARFSRTLSDLLMAGVPVNMSLDLTADVLHLVPYQNSVRTMRQEVAAGAELAEVIADSGRFEPDVLAYIETGEETGELPESLGRLARDYQEQVDFMVKNLGSLIQPLIVIVLGGIVGFVALAFIMAYISVLATLGGGF